MDVFYQFLVGKFVKHSSIFYPLNMIYENLVLKVATI